MGGRAYLLLSSHSFEKMSPGAPKNVTLVANLEQHGHYKETDFMYRACSQKVPIPTAGLTFKQFVINPPLSGFCGRSDQLLSPLN